MKRQAVSISDQTHKRLSQFCRKNRLIMKEYVDMFINQRLDEIESEPNPFIKKNAHSNAHKLI